MIGLAKREGLLNRKENTGLKRLVVHTSQTRLLSRGVAIGVLEVNDYIQTLNVKCVTSRIPP